ncbi:MAG: hypothetical protein LAN63_19190 [Acidobacteriia bacterium]|nr:hypothetical protein [Terriglobia bacterium]
MFLKGTGREEVDERKLPDHQPHHRKKKAPTSVFYADDAPKAVKPEQLCFQNVTAGDRESARAFDVKSGVIQPRLAFRNFGFESEFGPSMEEYFVSH